MYKNFLLGIDKSDLSMKNISIKEAQQMLNQSELVGKLIVTPKQRPHTFVGLRAHEWRLLELSEISFTIP